MERRNRFWTWAALLLLALTAAIPLAAPVFPTQDGPVHLYYVDVLRGLLHHSAPYAEHFQIKSSLTPYALEYYSLLALEFFFSPVLSEKVLVVAYIFAFGLGFRYLVESVAGRGSPWILTGIPFCLNMLLYMGFLNYCMALAVLLFACGFWIRYAGRLTVWRTATMAGSLTLMLLTHPVPAAVFLIFTAICLAAGRAHRNARAILLVAGMAILALAWVGPFLHPSLSGERNRNYLATMGWFDTVATELQLYHLSPFRSLIYRAGLILPIALAGAAVIAGLCRRGMPFAARALVAASAACFAAYCLVPQRMNGSFYFAERFPILWVLFLLAGASAIPLPRFWNLAAGGLAIATTVGLLVQQHGKVDEIAARIALADGMPPAKPGDVGLIVASSRQTPPGLQFNPYMWSAVHYFRRSRAILANDPWMDMPQIMLRPVRPNRWSYLDPDDAEAPFLRSAAGGTSAQDLDFVVHVGPPDPPAGSVLTVHRLR